MGELDGLLATNTAICPALRKTASVAPLVFRILPLSVLYAVFPGVFMLRLGIG